MYPDRITHYLVAGLIALMAGSALATDVYKVVDENGNVSFTDQPPKDTTAGTVERVQLSSPNSATPPPEMPEPAAPAPEPEAVAYETVITSPPDGTTMPMGPGNFVVSAMADPALGGDRLRLLMDGEPLGEPQTSRTWQLTNVNRGEHQLTVERVNSRGKVLDRSLPITVYVMRPSINSPVR